MSQLKLYYEKEVISKLMETFKYKSVMQVPKLNKIVLNIGLGEAIHNVKLLDAAVEELKVIAGQKPVVTRARKSIAAFKLRAGMPIGCMVTLRRKRMYDFYYFCIMDKDQQPGRMAARWMDSCSAVVEIVSF